MATQYERARKGSGRVSREKILFMHACLKSLAIAVLLSVSALAAHAQNIGTVNFDFDSAELDAAANAKLDEIAERLKEIDSYKPTVVVGYTDAVGSAGYNVGLGQRRANAVAQALVARGVPVDRVGSVESRGENDLIVSVATAERRNRRVNVTLDEILGACRNYREVALTRSSVGAELQNDLQARLNTAKSSFSSLRANGQNTPAFQMAGAAREACEIAVSYDPGEFRKVEYAQRCFCNAARLEVALGR